MISATSSVLCFSALQTVSLPSVSRVIRSTDVQDEPISAGYYAVVKHREFKTNKAQRGCLGCITGL